MKPRHVVLTVIAAILLVLLALSVWAMTSFKLTPPNVSMPDEMEDAGEMILLYGLIAGGTLVLVLLMILGFGLLVGAGALVLSIVLLVMKPKPRVMHVISIVMTSLSGTMLVSLLAVTFLLS
jgi:hypothetical protein